MDTESLNSPFEVVFRGSDDTSDVLQMNELVVSTSTDTSDLNSRVLVSDTYESNRHFQMESSTSSPVHHLVEDSPLRETQSDPFKKPRWWREASSLSIIIASMIIFCVGITLAMIIQILVGPPQLIPHAGVLSDDAQCSRIGLEALRHSSKSNYQTASTVDAALLTSLCLIVKNPHKGGLGGGGFMLIEKQHDVKHDIVQINFREMSPSDTDTTLSVSRDQVSAGQSVAVPGLVKGLQLAHKKFGKADWKKLFDQISMVASRGVPVSEELATAISSLDIASVPSDLRNLIMKDDNVTLLAKNDTIKQPKLAETLRILGENPDSFYNGALADSLVKTVKAHGSSLKKSDLKSYRVESNTDVLKVKYSDMAVAATGVPSSGPALLSTMNFLSKYPVKDNISSDYLLYHRMLEALKFSYGYQASWENCSQVNDSLQGLTPLDEILDNRTFPIGHYLNGTQPLLLNSGGEQHVTVVGYDGFIVTIVMGIGSPFGSKIMSSGYLLNNAMLDFSWPGKYTQDGTGLQPSQANTIAGGKRPISSMVASFVLPDSTKCGLYVGFDAHGGTSTISSLVQTIIRKASGMNIGTSISTGRLNQDMIPDIVEAEDATSPGLVNFLKSLGHNVTTAQSLGTCSAVTYFEGKVVLYGDLRDEEDVGFAF